MNDPIRLVTEDELHEISEWAVPQYNERHPRFKLEYLLPLLHTAIKDPTSLRLVRTNNACGLFAIEHSPWEPLPVVCDIFVVGKPKVFGSPFAVCRLYRYGLELAKRIGAAEFRYGTDGLCSKTIAAIAKRVGFDIVAVNYVKKLPVISHG